MGIGGFAMKLCGVHIIWVEMPFPKCHRRVRPATVPLAALDRADDVVRRRIYFGRTAGRRLARARPYPIPPGGQLAPGLAARHRPDPQIPWPCPR
jgi:hypothetical protein